jgi:hypothetical protein
VSVFAELKRRNVFRVAALYLVAAWVLLLLVGLLGLPAWTNKLLFVALVLGFVPALIFSWVYELTPEGLKREHEVERNASITAETARKLDLIVVGLLVIAIVVVAVERFLPRTAPTTDAASGASSADAPVQAAAKSIAVLPFADMSAGKDQEYFSTCWQRSPSYGLPRAPRPSSSRVRRSMSRTWRRSSTSRTSWKAACASPATRSASRRS